MTIPEACSLVLQTGGVGKNGMSYLLDMGEAVKIIDLAKQVIKFSGFTESEMPVTYIGLRPGERLVEPLWLREENPTQTQYPKILHLTNIPAQGYSLDELCDSLKDICQYNCEKAELYRNREKLLEILCKVAPTLDEFYHDSEIKKLMAQSQEGVL